MTKSTAVIFILLFAVCFKLEKAVSKSFNPGRSKILCKTTIFYCLHFAVFIECVCVYYSTVAL